MFLANSKMNSTNTSVLLLFVRRSDSFARTYKGSFTLQHSLKDPTAACRHQGRQASPEGDEERERVPHYF